MNYPATQGPTALRQLVLGRQSCWSSKRCLRQTFNPQLPHSQEFLAKVAPRNFCITDFGFSHVTIQHLMDKKSTKPQRVNVHFFHVFLHNLMMFFKLFLNFNFHQINSMRNTMTCHIKNTHMFIHVLTLFHFSIHQQTTSEKDSYDGFYQHNFVSL